MQQGRDLAAKAMVPAPKSKFQFDTRTWGPLIALVLLMVLGTVLNPVFLSSENLMNVLARTAFIGIIAVGATFVIVSGGIDLSVGSMAAFLAGVMILVMNKLVGSMGAGWSTILAGMGIALALGLAAGAINGLLATKGKIEPFIVTLGAMGLYRSLVTYLANGGTLLLDWGVRDVYRPVYYGSFLGIATPIWIFVIVAMLGGLLLNKTRFGRYCKAIGSNEDVARYSAIHIDWIKTLTYMLQGVCVAIATIIYVPRLGSASGQTGILWELEAIAAVIIGGTALKGGYGRIWGTMVGVIMLSMIDNIMNLTNIISQYLNGAVQGVIIIAAALLQRRSRSR